MDNVKWGKRYSTIFWWTLAILPFFISLIGFIGYHLTFNSGINTSTELIAYQIDSEGTYLNILERNIDLFNTYTPGILKDVWNQLFTIFELNGTIYPLILSYMTWILFIHVIFDIVAWLPRFLHSLLESRC